MNRKKKLLVGFVVGLIPAFVTFALIHFRLQTNLTDFIPSAWNDQTGFWTEVASFQKVGLNVGYYGWDESPAPAPFIRAGVHGYTHWIAYGILARLFGWTYYTGILFNLLFLALGVTYFIYALDLDRRQILLTGILLATFSPVIYYTVVISSESFYQGAAFLLAVLFYQRLLQRDRLARSTQWGTVVLLFFLAVARTSWGLLFLPFFLLGNKAQNFKTILGALLKSAVLIVLCLVVTSFTSATASGSNSITKAIRMSLASPSAGLKVILDTAAANLKQYASVFSLSSLFGMLEVYRLAYLALSCLFLGILIYFVVKKRQPMATGDGRAFSAEEVTFHALNLVIPWLATMLVYLVDGEHRVLGVHLLLSLLLLIKFNRFLVVVPVLVVNLLGMPSLIADYGAWKSNFTVDPVAAGQVHTLFAGNMVYDGTASNPWCNTAVVSLSLYDYRVLQIPSGIGLMAIVLPNNIHFPMKSRYLVLTSQDYTWFQKKGGNAQLLGQIPALNVNLYQNRDSGCGALALKLMQSLPYQGVTIQSK